MFNIAIYAGAKRHWPTCTAEDHVRQLLRTETKSLCKTRRRLLSEPMSNPLTEQEVALLQNLRDHPCFYCTEEIAEGITGLPFHTTHYEATATRKITTSKNTVLACPACNVRKRNIEGYTFKLQMLGRRQAAMKLQYATPRRRFRVQLDRLGCEHAALITHTSRS